MADVDHLDDVDDFDQHPHPQVDDGALSHTPPENGTVTRIDKNVGIFGMIVASICVLMSATKFVADGGDTYSTYAIAAGGVGIVLGAVLVGVGRFPSLSPLMIIVSAFLAVWWSIAACVMTFKGPFVSLGNGYVAVYAAAFFSVVLFVEVLPGHHKERVLGAIDGANEVDTSKRWIVLCLIASVVEMIEASVLCDEHCYSLEGSTKRLAGYAVSVGVISMCLSVLLLPAGIPDSAKDSIKCFLAVWWTAALISLTFSSFTFSVSLMNGFLGTWAATIASYGMALPLVAHYTSECGGQAPSTEYDELGGDTEYGHDGLGHDDLGPSDSNSYAAGTGNVV